MPNNGVLGIANNNNNNNILHNTTFHIHAIRFGQNGASQWTKQAGRQASITYQVAWLYSLWCFYSLLLLSFFTHFYFAIFSILQTNTTSTLIEIGTGKIYLVFVYQYFDENNYETILLCNRLNVFSLSHNNNYWSKQNQTYRVWNVNFRQQLGFACYVVIDCHR